MDAVRRRGQAMNPAIMMTTVLTGFVLVSLISSAFFFVGMWLMAMLVLLYLRGRSC
jgi:hypothetical protein